MPGETWGLAGQEANLADSTGAGGDADAVDRAHLVGAVRKDDVAVAGAPGAERVLVGIEPVALAQKALDPHPLVLAGVARRDAEVWLARPGRRAPRLAPDVSPPEEADAPLSGLFARRLFPGSVARAMRAASSSSDRSSWPGGRDIVSVTSSGQLPESSSRNPLGRLITSGGAGQARPAGSGPKVS
jgi:hypothetical protein